MRFDILLSIPKTIYFNFKYLPFKQAYKLPIWVSYDCYCKAYKGAIELPKKINFAMIRIGFHGVAILDKNVQTKIIIEKGSKIYFKGTAHIGKGSKVVLHNNKSQVIFGDNFTISSASTINCYKKIEFGRNVLFSWDCLVMDDDTHCIIDKNNQLMNPAKGIILGNNVWIGCRTMILKGSIIPDNCVIGANTIITGKEYKENTIIAGNPAKSIKEISHWYL